MLNQTLVLFKGLMGSGKSTVSQAVGKRLGWPVINIDDIGDVFITRQLPERKPASYDILFALGKSLLEQNFSVILEATLRGKEGFERAKQISRDLNVNLRVVECCCSDDEILKHRLETRPYRPTQLIKDWQGFLEYREKALPDFNYPIDSPILSLDTTEPLQTITNKAVEWLQNS